MKTKLYFLFFLFVSIFALDVNAQAISSGGSHSLAICTNGTVMALGYNADGQLGDGSTTDRIIPVQVSGLTGITAVAAGGGHSLFLKSDSTVWACGDNYYGQLGIGNNNNKTVPVQVIGMSKIIGIYANGAHSIFLKVDGTVWACGYNNNYQLGLPSPYQYTICQLVSNISGVKAISTGFGTTLFLKSDGTVWGCGTTYNGQFGSPNSQDDWPVQVNITDVTSMAAGADHSLFLKNDGTVWACGWNLDGQLGDGTTVEKEDTIVQVSGINAVKAISAGVAHSIFLRSDGTVWSCGRNTMGQLGDGTLIDKNMPQAVSGLDGIAAIDGGVYNSFFLKNDGTVWGCGNNVWGELGDGTLINRTNPVQCANLCQVPQPAPYPHVLNGILYDDADSTCSKQSLEQGMSFIVKTDPGNIYSLADDTGSYSIGVYDWVNYDIQPIIPQRLSHLIGSHCPPSYNVYLDASDPVDTAGFDFGFHYAPCYQLKVDVTVYRRRRCFRNKTRIYYANEGFIAANGVEVKVRMPSYVIPLSASLSFTWDIDSNMVFNLGTLNANQSGYITIIDSIACLSGISGLTQCTKAWITPANTCLINSTTGANWDQSSITVEGKCVNDSARFKIYNTGVFGNGDMDAPSEYRIYADNILIEMFPFQLAGNDSLVVKIVSGGATIRMEADQRPGHPGNSHPRETIEGCGTNSNGTFTTHLVNTASQDDEDINVEIDCLEIIDSYDPNDKQVSPSGIGVNKVVAPKTPLDYTIRFQNTGTDTAYKVVVVDTLSQHLDISTLELGASSYPYTFSLSGAGRPVFKLTFNNINLTDTVINEPGSHGFVKFKIAPYDTVAIGTEITNAADIFFDYNDPIRTNTVQIRIDTLVYTPDYLVNVNTQPSLNNFYCSGDSVSMSASFSGIGASYQWFKNNQPLIGKTDSILSIAATTLDDTGSYYATVIGDLNSLNTDTVFLNVRNVTTINTSLNDITACEGTSGASLNSSVTGSNISYQWYKNGSILVNDTNSLLNFNTLTLAQTGVYSLVVSGDCGIKSDTAIITVTDINIPAVLSQGSTLTVDTIYETYQWINCSTNTIISGANNQSYTAPVNGGYAVIVTQGSCIDTSACAYVTVGINDMNDAGGFKLYPNPTKGSLQLETSQQAQLTIYTLLGAVVYETQLQKGKQEINISHLANGVYMLTVAGDKEVQTVRVIKQ